MCTLYLNCEFHLSSSNSLSDLYYNKTLNLSNCPKKSLNVKKCKTMRKLGKFVKNPQKLLKEIQTNLLKKKIQPIGKLSGGP